MKTNHIDEHQDGCIIFGGTYPGDEREIFRVTAAYNHLSSEQKKDSLESLLSWTEKELKNTNHTKV